MKILRRIRDLLERLAATVAFAEAGDTQTAREIMTKRKYYTKNAWEGKNYDPSMDITGIAKMLRLHLRDKFPKCKFSIRIERYSGGQSLTVALMNAPFEALAEKDGYGSMAGQLSKYAFKKDYDKMEGNSNGIVLTKEAWDVMSYVAAYADSFNYSDSDGMIDYFDTNFYLHLEIGRYDKPFERI